MLNNADLNKQVGRLLSLPFTPNDVNIVRTLREEFRTMFQDRCLTDQHLRQAGDLLMKTLKRCPAPAEIGEAAASVGDRLRAQERKDDREEWKRIYGPPQPFDSKLGEQTAKYPPSRDEELWRLLRQRFPNTQPNGERWPNWKALAVVARELGYEDYAEAWERADPL